MGPALKYTAHMVKKNFCLFYYSLKITFYTEGEFVGKLGEAVVGKTSKRPLIWNTMAHLGIPTRLGVP